MHTGLARGKEVGEVQPDSGDNFGNGTSCPTVQQQHVRIRESNRQRRPAVVVTGTARNPTITPGRPHALESRQQRVGGPRSFLISRVAASPQPSLEWNGATQHFDAACFHRHYGEPGELSCAFAAVEFVETFPHQPPPRARQRWKFCIWRLHYAPPICATSARMSSTLHAVQRGPSFTGEG